MSRLERIPIFDTKGVTLEDFHAVYNVFKCVCLQSKTRKGAEPNVPSKEIISGRKRRRPETKQRTEIPSSSSPLALSDANTKVLEMIWETFESASPRDKESWNVENIGKGNDISSPSEFFSSMTNPRSNSSDDQGYCSFVLQDNSNDSVSSFTKRIENIVTNYYGEMPNLSNDGVLPHSLLLTNKKNTAEMNGKTRPSLLIVAPHYWIFFGWNSNRDEGLPGRREHTDSIEHDGTFHHQLVGGKLWKLRPTQELKEICDAQHDTALLDNYEILVQEGDVFVINTRLWWHQTEIPTGWSVSYARDLYLRLEQGCATTKNLETEPDSEPAHTGVGNREVSWASGFIPKGTTLVVDDVIDSEDYDHEDQTISSIYDHLVPSTILRTHLTSRANLKLILLSNKRRFNGDASDSDEGVEEKPKARKQVALEALRDIQEGEEFMLLQKEQGTS